MKKLIKLLLVFVLGFCLIGCKEEKHEFRSPHNIIEYFKPMIWHKDIFLGQHLFWWFFACVFGNDEIFCCDINTFFNTIWTIGRWPSSHRKRRAFLNTRYTNISFVTMYVFSLLHSDPTFRDFHQNFDEPGINYSRKHKYKIQNMFIQHKGPVIKIKLHKAGALQQSYLSSDSVMK